MYTFDGTYHRSRSMATNLRQAIVLSDAHTVVNAADPSPGRVGAPLHVLVDGDHVASFPEPEGPRPNARPLLRRSLARESDSTFWAAHPNRYRIGLWTLSGSELVRLERQAPWFSPHDQVGAILPDEEPQPVVRDIHYSSDGFLWVLIHVAADGWADQFDPDLPADMSFNGDFHRYRNSRVEVLDVEAGRLVAVGEFERYFSGFSTAGHLMSYHEVEVPLPYIDVLSVGLGPPGG